MRKSIDNVNRSDDPKTGSPDADVLDVVHALMHQYRSMQYRALRAGPLGITHMDSKVLGFFGARPGATQQDLARHSGRDKAQLARLVKGLREQGLLKAEPDPDDRRNQRLSLTPEGRALQRGLHRQAKHLNAAAIAGLSAEEHRMLLELLHRVQANLDKAA